jgi:hypothetical protein
MQKTIIVYSFDNSEINSNEIIKHLYEMKNELEKHDLSLNEYDIIDGNSKFPKTKLFLEQSFEKKDEKHAINCDEIVKEIDAIAQPFIEFRQTKNEKEILDQNVEKSLKNEIKNEHKKRFLAISKSKIGQFWKDIEEYNFPNFFDYDFFNTEAQKFYDSVNGHVLMIVDRKFESILGENVVPGAHGVRKYVFHANCLVLYIKGYKEIIWHEAAHLLGAEDHYNPNSNSHEAIQDCLNPNNCIMQWNPGDTFCEKSIDEIRNCLSKELT